MLSAWCGRSLLKHSMKSSNLACCCRKFLPAGLVVSSLSVRCMRSWRPFCCVAGLDALDLDAKAEPPNRELGEIEEGIWTGKRHTIIGTDGLGQAELPEGSLKHRKGVSFPGSRERLAGKDIAARRVSDRQRIAVAPIGQHELALV